MRRIERLLVPDEVLEDPLDDLRLLNARNYPQCAATATAGVDVDGERALEPLRLGVCAVENFNGTIHHFRLHN